MLRAPCQSLSSNKDYVPLIKWMYSYHYHSNYDDFDWMTKYGDPGFVHHVAIGQYLALLAYRLSTDTLLPYNATAFSEAMYEYFTDLQTLAGPASTNGSLNLHPLQDALDLFKTAADEVMRLGELAKKLNDGKLKTVVNHKLRDFERGFTSQGGFPGREFYKHRQFFLFSYLGLFIGDSTALDFLLTYIKQLFVFEYFSHLFTRYRYGICSYYLPRYFRIDNICKELHIGTRMGG